MKKKKILLIIPAYNEQNNIIKTLRDIKNSDALEKMDVLVINDGSKDNTEQSVKNEGFDVLTQIFNSGYGTALQTGYKYATDNGYEYLLQMDADGQHDVRNLDRLLEKIIPNENSDKKQADIVIGTRFLKGSESFYISKLKIIAIKLFRFVIKLVTKYELTDPTSGLMGLNRAAFSYYAKYMNFDIKYPDLNMIVQMLLLGYHIEEIPAIMHERTEGESMHDGLMNVAKYMLIMTLSTFNAFMRFRKGKGR